MLLVVDNGSIFTQELLKFLSEKKIPFTNSFHDTLSLDSISQFDSFILSGRRKNDKKMNLLNSKIIEHVISNSKKLLGICYGAEILALTLGGTIKKMDSPRKGNHLVNILKKNPLCEQSITVFESHHYMISRLMLPFVTIAESENCNHEIIQYSDNLVFGTQFHPEMSDDGNKIIEKFCFL